MEWARKFFGSGVLDPEIEKMLSEQQRKSLGQGALMDAGIAMLQNSGYSPVPQTLGQALGAGLGAGRQSVGMNTQALQVQMAEQAKRQQEEAEERAWQEFAQTLPPEMGRVAVLLGRKEGAKMIAEQTGRKELEELKGTIRAKGSGPRVVSPGSAVWDPETRTVLFDNPSRPANFATVDIPMPDGSVIRGQRDPSTGDVYDLAGRRLSAGPRSQPTAQPKATPAAEIIAAIEDDAGRKLTDSERKQISDAIKTGKDFSVPMLSDSGFGVQRPPEEQTAATERAKAEEKARAQAPQAKARLDDALNTSMRVRAVVEEAKNMAGPFSTGVAAQLTQGLGGTPARNLRAKLNTVKANLGFQELSKMREMSPTGGALGNVSNIELEMLQSTIESLDQLQSHDEVINALVKIDTHLANWEAAVREAYNLRYGRFEQRQDRDDDALINKYLGD